MEEKLNNIVDNLGAKMRTHKRPLLIALGAALILTGGVLFFGEGEVPQREVAPLSERAFPRASLEAQAAYVWDIAREEVIFAKNAEDQLPLASLAKVMTGWIAATTLPHDTPVAITSEAILAEGDSGLITGELWRAKDLLDFTLIESSNDGAHALAGAVANYMRAETNASSSASFVELMNTWAGELGLAQTYFLNPSGLDVNTSWSGAYGSARDVALLFGRVLQSEPHLLSATRQTSGVYYSLSGTEHRAKNTNQETARIPGLVASKTGFTDLAGGNLAIVFEVAPSHPIAVVVLGSSREGRISDVERLVAHTAEYFSSPYLSPREIPAEK